MIEILINWLPVILPLALGYFIGVYIEKKHYKSIEQREAGLLHLPVITAKKVNDPENIDEAAMVYGSVVISLDYFKLFLAGLRNFFGGRIVSYETLLDRGRREAVLRMKERAQFNGYDMILNMRFETSSIGYKANKKGTVGCFEVLAYGTAIKIRK